MGYRLRTLERQRPSQQGGLLVFPVKPYWNAASPYLLQRLPFSAQNFPGSLPIISAISLHLS